MHRDGHWIQRVFFLSSAFFFHFILFLLDGFFFSCTQLFSRSLHCFSDASHSFFNGFAHRENEETHETQNGRHKDLSNKKRKKNKAKAEERVKQMKREQDLTDAHWHERRTKRFYAIQRKIVEDTGCAFWRRVCLFFHLNFYRSSSDARPFALTHPFIYRFAFFPFLVFNITFLSDSIVCPRHEHEWNELGELLHRFILHHEKIIFLLVFFKSSKSRSKKR